VVGDASGQLELQQRRRNISSTANHQILIVGGGTARISVAARLLRKGYLDVAVIEPSSTNKQPLWTLVGVAARRKPRRPSALTTTVACYSRRTPGPPNLTVALPPGGLWVRPAAGPTMPVALRRFGGGFSASLGSVLPGRAAAISHPAGVPIPLAPK
jgi:hypothetical protein